MICITTTSLVFTGGGVLCLWQGGYGLQQLQLVAEEGGGGGGAGQGGGGVVAGEVEAAEAALGGDNQVAGLRVLAINTHNPVLGDGNLEIITEEFKNAES